MEHQKLNRNVVFSQCLRSDDVRKDTGRHKIPESVLVKAKDMRRQRVWYCTEKFNENNSYLVIMDCS